MDVNAPTGLLRAFADLKDPRVNRTKKYSLGDILALAICAVICGADGWARVAKFGRCKRKRCCPTAFPPTTPSVGSSRPWTRRPSRPAS